MESLKALLLGGVVFETPAADVHLTETSENHVFPLFAYRETVNAASYTRKIPGVVYFPGSISGLAPGSEVTMHGLEVGEVTDVRFSYEVAKDAIVAPVRFEVQPVRSSASVSGCSKRNPHRRP